ncbi:hypothetical protein FJU08_06225 [Martelella alba]|uniref:Uncharacterized protein n=1 Tax=Martelella alba TaxID=2590451 RepID=A0A506UDS7_9HYPH|nr:hypothetical protein [Martelella alba]TPW32583.1 hypothetical protein FJU08_06225 [Martelella alba]
MAGRIKDSERFYNRMSLDDAIFELEALWPGLSRSRIDVRKTADRRPNPLWVGDGENGHAGVRVMILATHLIYRFLSDRIIRIADLAKAAELGFFPDETLRAAGIADSESRRRLRYAIAELASENNRNTPYYNPAWDRLLFCHFACAARKAILRNQNRSAGTAAILEEASALYDRIIAAHCKTAGEIFQVIRVAWIENLPYRPPRLPSGTPGAPAAARSGPARHYIPEKLADYLGPAGRLARVRIPEKLSELVERVLDQFSHARERIALISGKKNAGKSGCVIALLRRLQYPDNTTIGFHLKPDDIAATRVLPVFTVSVQDHSGSDLMLLVLAFLSSLDEGKRRHSGLDHLARFKSLRQEFGLDSDGSGMKDLRERIAKLHARNPALFILTNWDDLSWSTPRAQLRDLSKTSLIRLLHDSNGESRILLTTTETPTLRASRLLPRFRTYRLDDPRLRDVRRYLPALAYPAVYGEALFEAGERFGNNAVPGDQLILLAAMLEVCRGDSAWEKRAIALVAALKPRDQHPSGGIATGPLARLLLERLDHLGLVHAVALIMACDDGLRPDTLSRLLQRSNRDVVRKPEDIITALTALEGLSNSFLLRRRVITVAACGEARPEGESYLEIFEALRQLLMSVLGDPDEAEWAAPYCAILRDAMRQIALLCFDRAQEWRCRNLVNAAMPRWRDMLLDIQSYEALLASLDPQALEDQARNRADIAAMPLLHHAREVVFLRGPEHSPAVALRFAVRTILFDIIDRDDRLSLNYAQDLMRLHLYLLIFLQPGQRHLALPDDCSPKALPACLPIWIRSVFTDAEIFRLLETIALSALQVQAPEIVRWAFERAEELKSATGGRAITDAFVLHRITRIFCATIDMAIALGHPLAAAGPDTHGRKGHERTLRALEHFMNEHFRDVIPLTGRPPANVEAETAAAGRISALQRLRLRVAHLTYLTGDLDRAMAELDLIHDWEMAMARASGSGRASVLEGRPARIALDIMMSRGFLPSLQSGHDNRSDHMITRRIGGMIEANMARLSRFGGAEQSALLIDRARFALMQGQSEEAWQYASIARALYLDSRICHCSHVQTVLNLLILLSRWLESWNARHTSGVQITPPICEDEVVREIDTLYETARALDLKPAAGKARFLKIRFGWLCRKREGGLSPEWRDIARADLKEAIALMKSCADRSLEHDMQALLNQL